MIADWFAIYLVSRGYSLEQTAAGYWVPFLASGLGNFFGGGFSGWLIRRGWPVGRARRLVIAGGSLGVFALIPAAFATSYVFLLACFAVATFSYAAMSTMANSLPADLFQSRTVATVAGHGGDGRGDRHHRRDATSSASSPTASPSPRSWWSRASCRSPPRSSSSPSCATRSSRAAASSR